jgi:sodium/bile acid cotransporter 7
VKDNKFIVALFLAVLIAWVFPWAALFKNGLPIGIISRLGISLIFFFHGLKLGKEKLMLGIGNFRLHIVIQLTTFLLFPLVVLLFYPLMKTEIQQTLWLAVFFLAALPSAISASVIMTSLAKGNEPAAIFNASISGLIGIIVTPFWMGLFMQAKYGDFDFSGIMIRLFVEIVLPVFIGVALRPRFISWVTKNGPRLPILDKSVILLIVYKSFSDSFNKGSFSEIGGYNIFVLLVLVSLLFVLVYSFLLVVSRRVGFVKSDRITCLFCGSMKSLIHGTVFSNVIFGPMTIAGLMLLPIMLYHSLQIFVIGIIATRFTKKLV